MTAMAKTTTDDRNVFHKLTPRERIWLLPGVLDVWFALTYWTGLRDRLRCPKCQAVGTWKMHGTWLERWMFKDISVRRWLCKWCGHYIGPAGRTVAFPDLTGMKVWRLPEDGLERQSTPAEVLKEHKGAQPWHG